ncbi:cryptochrome/photolyase family protein [Mucilaginibacter gossypii]|uniref:cryptochrome/photolyase family protein n=1 Tax=Mucilaginibacter gossypii TaxID=551996 RepID=UPI000DCDC681|nr:MULTISPECIES: cryptochrome/photolyase family protein [Mucilaginibacter]QTE36469.1 cryptochrome/photolyase family protein [Mucilaginibacter gossypii]RAV48628.1 cryptochrome/photolyase family protein [Mucilaginibacter rubeus]
MQQNSITLIFPHQLFKHNPQITQLRPAYLVEEILFFNQYSFNKKKLVLHRASMKFYAHHLASQNIAVNYIGAQDPLADVRRLITSLAKKGIKNIYYTDTADNWLESRLNKACVENEIQLIKHRSPNFLNSPHEVADFFDKKKTYFQTDFYISQRRQRNILLEPDGTPIGGKWTYDSENRLRFPKNEVVPLLNISPENDYLKEARLYVDTHFADNYGNTTSPFGNLGGFYPTTHEEAEHWLDDFLQQRFRDFGIYEDAMVANESFLYHSVLSPTLNIGLLNPQQVIDNALDVAADMDIPLNSLEGFVRQIMGWREFIHIVYEREGTRQRTKNYWGFKRRISHSFWKGNTGIHPVDVVIKKVLATGYTHHIERLMVMGNFFLLCEFHPDDVYRWFMEMYIDAYDWVMVPNTYGMTQFADGGLMMTKPYISGSNYLLKMGDWKKGDWQDTWDGLFWRFMHVHRNFFSQNPRLGMLVKTFDKMPAEKRRIHLNNAEQFLENLDKHAAPV